MDKITKKNKSNKQAIKPSIWGPHGWKFMHYVSLGYPNNPTENDKLNYKTLSCLILYFLLLKNLYYYLNQKNIPNSNHHNIYYILHK